VAVKGRGQMAMKAVLDDPKRFAVEEREAAGIKGVLDDSGRFALAVMTFSLVVATVLVKVM
jgi:hypothetical protein